MSDKKLAGLWIDTLVFNFLKQSETYKNISYKSYGELVKDFFKYLFDQYELSPDQKIWKAPGSNQNVHGSWQNHRKMKKAYQLCLEATEDISVANEKGISLTCRVSDDIPDEVIGDDLRIIQILNNLLSNAIKYSYPNGEIQISVESRNDFYEISVKDSGVGMTEEVRMSLFSLTHTGSKLGTANEKGTGLGLIICKEFIEKNGGNIWVESEPKKGSRFKFCLPVYQGK